ncbi:MAG: GGDEF domain-containing protein [Pseudomonadales bacterium]
MERPVGRGAGMWKPAGFTPELERDFQAELAPTKVRLTRMTMLMALAMNAGFALLDPWVLQSALTQAWWVRGVMSAGAIVCFSLSFLPGFPRYYTASVAGAFVVLGSGVLGLIMAASPGDLAYDFYFVGLVLVAMALHVLTFLNVVVASACSLGFLMVYLVIAVTSQNYLESGTVAVLATNMLFFVSIVAIAIVGQVVRDSYARENYVLRHSLAHDVELKEEAHRRALWIAENDALTGIGNRLHFEREGARLLVDARQAGRMAIVLFIDLNNFKDINDNYGHAVGDRALRFTAEQIRHCLQPGDVVARNGGDEFVVCLVRDDRETLAMLAARILHRLQQGMRIRGKVIEVGASIGIACAPLDGDTLADVLAVADREMYRIKDQGLHGYSLSESLRQHDELPQADVVALRRTS